MVNPLIQTARLRLVPISAFMAEDLEALFATPRFRRYLCDDEIMPRSWIDQTIVKSEALFASSGLGIWALYPVQQTRLVGICGFFDFFDPPERELIFGLAHASWGKGYATEAAHAVVRYGFEELNMREIKAHVDVPNTASHRVLERIGFQKEAEVVREGSPLLCFRLKKEAFPRPSAL